MELLQLCLADEGCSCCHYNAAAQKKKKARVVHILATAWFLMLCCELDLNELLFSWRLSLLFSPAQHCTTGRWTVLIAVGWHSNHLYDCHDVLHTLTYSSGQGNMMFWKAFVLRVEKLCLNI